MGPIASRYSGRARKTNAGKATKNVATNSGIVITSASVARDASAKTRPSLDVAPSSRCSLG